MPCFGRKGLIVNLLVLLIGLLQTLQTPLALFAMIGGFFGPSLLRRGVSRSKVRKLLFGVVVAWSLVSVAGFGEIIMAMRFGAGFSLYAFIWAALAAFFAQRSYQFYRMF